MSLGWKLRTSPDRQSGLLAAAREKQEVLVLFKMLPSSRLSQLKQQRRVALFFLLGSITGVWGMRVIVPQQVNAVLGKNVTLECTVADGGSNVTLIQSSWERQRSSGPVTVAVYNPSFGISIPPEFRQRLYYRSPSSHDATVVLENVSFSDVGMYTCDVHTFPLGNFEASTTVSVLVEPKVYVSAGSTALIDGGNETVVATCIAERARPPAEVSWESNLFGQSDVHLYNEANGTTRTEARYLWQPSRHVQGHTLTCVVRHPALQTDFRIPYQLNVQWCRIENCESCFSKDFCTKCKPGFYLHKAHCYEKCPEGFAPLEDTRECGEGCEVGQWSEWGACTRRNKTCGFKWGLETRTRHIVKKPPKDTLPCPTINESRMCNMAMRPCRRVSLDRGRTQLDNNEKELLKEIRELRQKLAARAKEGSSASVNTLSSGSQWLYYLTCLLSVYT